MDSFPLSILFLNDDFSIFYANRYFCNSIKVSQTSLTGLPFSDITNFDIHSYISSSDTIEKYSQIEISFNKQDPKEFFLLLTKLAIDMSDGSRNLFVLILQDPSIDEFDQKINPIYQEWIKEAKNNISLIVYSFESGYGPKPIFIVNDKLFTKSSDPVSHVISKMGLYLMTAIAQGTTQSTGLFGPLPVSGSEFEDINVIVYALHVNDKGQTDPRTHGTRYIIISIFYPKIYERLILNRRRIRSIILNYFQIDDLMKINQSLITKMYDEIFLSEAQNEKISPIKGKKGRKKRKKKLKPLDSKLLEIIEFQNRLRNIFDLDTTLNEIANMLEMLLDFKLLAIFGYDKFANELFILSNRGYYDYKIKNYRINILETSVAAKAAHSQKTIYVPDIKKIDYYLEVDSSIKSDLAVPIKTNDDLLGVIIAESEKLDGFSQDDINILEILAESTANAIFQHSNEMIVHDLNVLLKNILVLDFDEAMTEIAKFAEILLNFELFCILDTRNEYVKFIIYRGYGTEENLPKFKRDDENFFVSKAYLTKEPMYIDNLNEHPIIPYFKINEKINAEYCIPILDRTKSRVLALINVESEKPLNRHELVIFETLANYTKILYRIFSKEY